MKTITFLKLAACCLLATPLRAAAETPVELLDNQGYPAGSYMAYVSAWGKGIYSQGVDYTESIRIEPQIFPGGVSVTWSWPQMPCAAVCGYDAIDFGDYNGTKVPVPIASKQIKAIAVLTEAHHFSIAGQTDGFDVIDDMFLTSGPCSKSPHIFEIEVFLHTPTYSATWMAGLKQIAWHTSSGITWTVTQAPNPSGVSDILFMPLNQADVPSGSVDIKEMLTWLVSRKVLTGDEWFNGMAIGVEPRQGVGSMSLNAFAVTYR